MLDRETTFVELRPLLFSLAYRMLGTRADAEDAVQEAYLRWQQAAEDEIRSPRAYLTTVVARLSLDALKAARRKREVYVGPWLPEPVVAPLAGMRRNPTRWRNHSPSPSSICLNRSHRRSEPPFCC